MKTFLRDYNRLFAVVTLHGDIFIHSDVRHDCVILHVFLLEASR